MEATNLTITSLLISVGGVGLCFYLTYRAWQRMHCEPSNERTWRFIASLALLTAFVTLLVTATGALLLDTLDDGALTAISHLSMALRGALLAQAIALAYGWRKTKALNGA